MGVNRHPDDVRLMLSYDKDALGAVRRVTLDAEAAEGATPLFRIGLSPAAFARLLSSGETVARSTVALPSTAAQADCQETQSDRGDCDGTVREYTVQRDAVCGQITGEPVLLCASHAVHHGQKIRRAVRPGICGEPVSSRSAVRCALPANHTARHNYGDMTEVSL